MGKINNSFKLLKKKLFEKYLELAKGTGSIIVFIGFEK
jgi:hypothetical protein